MVAMRIVLSIRGEYLNNVPFFSVSSSKYDPDTIGEVTVSLTLYFSKPPIMYPRYSVSLNSLDFEYQMSQKM